MQQEVFTLSYLQLPRIAAPCLRGVLTCLLIGVALLAPISAHGQTPQSLVFTPGKTATANIPNTSTFRNVENFSIDMRLHNIVQPSPLAFSDIMTMPGIRVLWHVVANSLLVFDDIDGFAPGVGTGLQVNLGSRTEFLLRIRRDYSQKQFSAEIWNVDGSGYQRSGPVGFATPNLANFNGTLKLGGTQSVFNLAYLRIRNDLPALNSQPPTGAQTGTLLNYELTGNGLDSSGNNRTLSLFSGAQFVPTPLYPPTAAVAAASMVLRAGPRQKLDGRESYSPNTGDELEYKWTYLDGPRPDVTPVWENPNVAEPYISGLTFGTHTIRLTVKDSSGQSSSIDREFGAVATDDKGIVVSENILHDKLLGPLLRYGLSPWTYFDDRHKGLADHFGNLQSTLFLDPWNTPLPGTISIPVNGTTVTGIGTTFKDTFCGGGTTPTGGNTLVIYYPRTDGSTGRRSMFINRCDSDTQLTLNNSYYFGAAANNIQYSSWVPSSTWLNGSSNANYYDNVLAFYSLYYRTGLTKYRDYARTLADRWWSTPYMDGGYSCDGISGAWCLGPRLRSLTGIYMRMLDGKPEYLPGLRKILDGTITGIQNAQNNSILGDMRENAYELGFLGLCAWLDPDDTAANRCADALESGMTLWKRLQQTDPQSGAKYWLSPTYGQASWNTQGGTSVSVTNNSNVVVGTGTNFQSAACGPAQPGQGFAFRTTTTPSNAIDGDMDKYYVRQVLSPTQLLLDRPYQGTTAAGRGWQCGSLVGTGIQPFMVGIVASAMNFAEIGLLARQRNAKAAEARQMVLDSEEWLRLEGYRPLANGLWYGRYYTNCEPISEAADEGCLAGNVATAREYAIESLNAYSQSYQRVPSENIRIFGDKIFGGIFGKNGGPYADGIYSSEIDTGGFYVTTNNAKYLGFLFGFGYAPTWLAARLGGVEPEDPAGSTLYDLEAASVESGASVRVRVVRPNGYTDTVTCTQTPCRLPVDARLGSHWLHFEYVLTNGEVRPDPTPRLLKIERL